MLLRPGATDAALAPVLDAVRRALAPHRGGRVAVALSGGRDSMALLDAAHCIAPELAVSLRAIHVHHGLSANADAWAAFCADQCGRRGIALDVRRVAVAFAGRDGVEAAARRARYDALASVDSDAIALAHHADDQAETLLLQLLRGGGPHGLAAMPASCKRDGIVLVRPLIGLRRAALARYAEARGLAWVDDESNGDRTRTRNLVRHELAPKLAEAFPGYPSTLVRAAALQAEYARLADELAAIDAEGAIRDGALARERLASLAPHRARNLLRWHLRTCGLRAPSAVRLSAMLDQLVRAGRDARVRLRHDGAEIGVHRGFVVVHAGPVAPYAVGWHGERELALPHGTLEFAPSIGEGIAAEALRERDVVVRSREGGERMRLAPRGVRQPLKQLLQGAGVPHWARADVPLVCCDGALAAVPGIGVDAAFAAAALAPSYSLVWRPRPQR